MYYDEQLFFNTLAQSTTYLGGSFNWLTDAILNEMDNFEGVHSRKMLIYFFCRLVTLPLDQLLSPDSRIRKSPRLVSVASFCSGIAVRSISTRF